MLEQGWPVTDPRFRIQELYNIGAQHPNSMVQGLGFGGRNKETLVQSYRTPISEGSETLSNPKKKQI